MRSPSVDLLMKVFSVLPKIYTPAHVHSFDNLALFDANLDTTFAGSAKNLFFFINGVTLNAARTNFEVSMSFSKGDEDRSVYTLLTVNVLLIGSDFSGYSNSVESSYMYAKLSQLEYVTDSNQGTYGKSIAQFDFRSSKEDSSPFDYLVDSDFGSGCGAIRKGGKMIVETGACAQANFYAFVTGFSNTKIGSTIFDVQALIVTDDSASENFLKYQKYEDQDTTKKGYIFKKDASDDTVGLWISYSANTI